MESVVHLTVTVVVVVVVNVIVVVVVVVVCVVVVGEAMSIVSSPPSIHRCRMTMTLQLPIHLLPDRTLKTGVGTTSSLPLHQ